MLIFLRLGRLQGVTGIAGKAGIMSSSNQFRPVLLGLVLVLLVVAPAAMGVAAEPCMKRVFNRFCLGGDVNEVLNSVSSSVARRREGDRLGLVFYEGQDKLYVLAFQGRIYRVLKLYEPATLLRYRDLRELLTRTYGAPVDESRYPAYARGPASQTGAIRRGEGQARLVWQPKPDWSVVLQWNRENGLSLAYQDPKARRAMQQAFNENP
jgi:hypothetical protein